MTLDEITKEAESYWSKDVGTLVQYSAALEFAKHCVDKAQQWRPIETAPKETEVLIGAFIDGKFIWGRSELFYEQANEFEGETFSGWVWSIDDVSDSVAEAPTHWQPLPPPPEAA